MQNQVIDFYSSLRQIFGVCECCGEIFRVSDCKLYQKKKPAIDWKEKIDSEISRLDRLEEKLQEKIELAREAAREAGRKGADKLVKKIDPIFSPLKLNPNDAKVIFHPVDFIVFNGMNSNSGDTSIKNLVLLDKNNRKGEYRKIQNSIENAINKSNYEWLTLRVEENGTITEE
jgi:predicted Holliday junction resolvase-like endonuclease